MLRFVVHPPEKLRSLGDLAGAHLIGNEGIPVRGEITCDGNEIRCTSRTQDPFALSLLWPVEDFGSVQLETTRLPPREAPYLLNLELARHRLMRITVKREEWGLFDYHGMEEIGAQLDSARDLFIAALGQLDDPVRAGELADQALRQSMLGGERMAQFHADIFLGRRQQNGGFSRGFLGVAVSPACPATALAGVRDLVDFVRVPFVWRDVQPTEHETRFERTDAWIRACHDAKLMVRGGPLLRFGVQFVPDWMYIWEKDFDTVVDYAKAHVQRCVKRHADKVAGWVVASGLHVDNAFSFTFEQIMEITRAASMTAREHAPRAQLVLDLTQLWGEYSAHNQRAIPPMLFADMAVQGGIPFDAFGLQFLFGLGSDGFHLRDLLQISSMIDRVANLGKPLHVTAVAVPSTNEPGGGPGNQGGQWRVPWSTQTQAEWLCEFCEIALSKPYVESVCFQSLADDNDCPVATGGLLDPDHAPKPACERLHALAKRLQTRTGS